MPVETQLWLLVTSQEPLKMHVHICSGPVWAGLKPAHDKCAGLLTDRNAKFQAPFSCHCASWACLTPAARRHAQSGLRAYGLGFSP